MSNAQGVPPTAALQKRIRTLVDKLGVGPASRHLGLGREATARLAAGLTVRKGTLLVALQALAKGA